MKSSTPRAMSSLNAQTFAAQVEHGQGYALVEFGAVWCSPCRAMEPALHALAEEKSETLKVGSIDADNEPEIASRYMVRGVPTLMLFHNGREIGRSLGAMTKRQIEQKLSEWMSSPQS